jgi:hypothetical protein
MVSPVGTQKVPNSKSAAPAPVSSAGRASPPLRPSRSPTSRGVVDEEPPEPHRGARLVVCRRQTRFGPPSPDGFVGLRGCVRSADWPLAGAGASATVSPSLAFRSPGRHLQSRLHRHRCNVNTVESPTGRWPMPVAPHLEYDIALVLTPSETGAECSADSKPHQSPEAVGDCALSVDGARVVGSVGAGSPPRARQAREEDDGVDGDPAPGARLRSVAPGL